MKNIPGARPFFLDKKKINSDIKKTLNSGILSSGPFLKKFESLFCKKNMFIKFISKPYHENRNKILYRSVVLMSEIEMKS